MILFWTITAAMILVALAFIVPPLLRKSTLSASDRDQQNVVIARERLQELNLDHAAGALSEEEYEQTKLELEQTLLIDLKKTESEHQTAGSGGRWSVLVTTVFVIAVTLAAYSYLGTPQMLDPQQMAAQQEGQPHSVEEMRDALVARLKENPDDPEGWYLLGRTYMAQQDFQKAVFAFDKVNQLVENEPSIMLALADAMAMASGGNMQGRVAELVRKAVALAPTHQTALWLAGMVEEAHGNYALALQYWQRLRPMLSENPESQQRVDTLIAGVQRRMAESGQAETSAQPSQPQEAGGAAITARISLSEQLATQAKPDEILFVYARAVQGPKMPLAAVRLRVADLPATVELNDAQAMVPGMNLSSVGEVVVGARISRSGTATASSGDLRGEVSPVKVGGAQTVQVVIDSIIP